MQPLVRQLGRQPRSTRSIFDEAQEVVVDLPPPALPVRGEDGRDSLVRKQELSGLDCSSSLERSIGLTRPCDLDWTDVVRDVETRLVFLANLEEQGEVVVLSLRLLFQSVDGLTKASLSFFRVGESFEDVHESVPGLLPLSKFVEAFGSADPAFLVPFDRRVVILRSQPTGLKFALDEIKSDVHIG